LADIEALFKACGGRVTTGAGSQARVVIADVRSTFHRPQPQPEANNGTMESVRRFLETGGIKP
jgi:hypothetical protein